MTVGIFERPPVRARHQLLLSYGGGRYIFGQAPDLSPAPTAASFRSSIHLHRRPASSGRAGNTLLYAYYGGIAIGQNAILDTTGKPIGYGYSGSPNGQNQTIQEGTLGFAQTFWKDAKYGAVTLMGQYSYLSRIPWYIAPGAARDAHIGMFFVNLRYSLPGAPPAKM